MRIRPWQLLLLLVVVLSALSLWHNRHAAQSPSDAPATPLSSSALTAPAATTRFAWSIGTRQVYKLSTQRVVHLRGRGPEPTDDTFPLTLTARYTTTVLQQDDVLVSLAARLDDIQLQMPGDPAARTQLQNALGRPFVLVHESNGKLRSLRLHHDVDAYARGFVKALIASLQLVRGPSGATDWQTQELDATGEYSASYRRDPAHSDGQHIQKTRQSYQQVRSAAGLMAVAQLGQITGALTVQLQLAEGSDEAVRLIQAEGRDQLTVDPGKDMPIVSSESSFSLTRIDGQQGSPQPHELAMLTSPDYTLSPLQMMDALDSDRRADEQQLKGASLADLMQALRALPTTDNGSQRAELQTKLSALFRTQPDAAKQAAAAIAAGLPEPVTKTLLGSLSGAQSAAGQAALVDLLNQRSLSSAIRENAVAVLGLSDAPTEATSEALHKAVRDADPDVRSTAALALGNAAGAQRQQSQVSAAEASVDELIQLYQAAQTEDEQLLYLQALGNAGDPRTLPMLQTATQSQSAAIRSAATQALRFVSATSVDALLVQLMEQDSAVEVRRAAVFSISFRPFLGFVASLQKAVLADKAAPVRQDVIQLFARYKQLPAVQQTLRSVSERDPSPEVRRAASELLR